MVSTGITSGCSDKAFFCKAVSGANTTGRNLSAFVFSAAAALRIGLPDGLSGCAFLGNLHTGEEQTL